MPYVALPPETRTSREALARARWDAIRSARPDLEPAVALQETLVSLVIRLTETVEHGRLPRLSLPPRYLAAKLHRGIPALATEPIPMPTAVLSPTLLDLCQALAQGGAGDAARHIGDAISNGSMDAGSLLSASLARDQKAIHTGGVHRGLSPDLVWLVSELAVSPFVYALQQALVASRGQRREGPDEAIGAALDAWPHGYCPICGSWPALAERWSPSRVLRCSFCALAWSLPTAACAYCGEAGEAFVRSSPDPTHPDRRLETCGTCHSYLKAIDVQSPAPFPLLAIADLETMDVDMTAMQSGYQRPPLRNFSLAGS
jgi:FdhE protein